MAEKHKHSPFTKHEAGSDNSDEVSRKSTGRRSGRKKRSSHKLTHATPAHQLDQQPQQAHSSGSAMRGSAIDISSEAEESSSLAQKDEQPQEPEANSSGISKEPQEQEQTALSSSQQTEHSEITIVNNQDEEQEDAPEQSLVETTKPSGKPLSDVPQTLSHPGATMKHKVPSTVKLLALDPIANTPLPSTEDKAEISSRIESVTPIPTTPIPLTPAPALPSSTPLSPLRSWRIILTYLLLLFAIISTALLWHDLSMPHLYIYTFDASNGMIKQQRDLGSYSKETAISNPIEAGASSFVMLDSQGTAQTRHMLKVAEQITTWNTTDSASNASGLNSLRPLSNNTLALTSEKETRVYTLDNRLLWRAPGSHPTQGTHYFQPANDGQNLYTVKALNPGQIAAYNLQNGTLQWNQTLDDTLAYTPPFQLDGNTLYVASDHKIYALNRQNGRVLWQQPLVARALQLNSAASPHLLLTAGPQGLLALNATTGKLAWTFNSPPGKNLTRPQLYQAILSKTEAAKDNIIYATGITWQIPQIQEQLWLFAIDASTGSLHWSQQLTTGLTGSDAGRTFTPQIDARHNIVVLQQQISQHEQRISAFDMHSGALRWSSSISQEFSSAPTLLSTPSGESSLFVLTVQSFTVLYGVVLLFILLSIAALVYIWRTQLVKLLAQLQNWLQHGRKLLRNIPGYARHYGKQLVQLARQTPRRFAIALLLLLVVLGVLRYALATPAPHSLKQVSALTGTPQWEQTLSAQAQALYLDTNGSIITTETNDQQHQLEVTDANGSMLWHSFVSEGAFSLPAISASPDTLLVALGDPGAPAYRFAPADPAYPSPLGRLLTLYQFKRATGQLLWQHTLNLPEDLTRASVLGADKNFIYVASRTSIQASPAASASLSMVQLVAINQNTGTIDWRISGPAVTGNTPYDNGKLLMLPNQAIWQVAGLIYSIDTGMGQIEWRRAILPGEALSAATDASPMARIADTLLIVRPQNILALDLPSGNTLWNFSLPNSLQDPASIKIAAGGSTALVSNSQQIMAFDIKNQRLLWSQHNFPLTHAPQISEDGKIAYVVTLKNDIMHKPVPTLEAIDMQSGAEFWTFHPEVQGSYIAPQADGLQYHNGLLFVTACLPANHAPCKHSRLYALNALSGSTLWKVEGTSITGIRISPDGKNLAYQLTTN
ncbi:hypothetical protein EPA93_39610 [Ktedonosporobacter rubrisoli]|uniref:Pyrrolo-quinoline quinone repeat domain-containing protein n=1 Tax=Ktedonosporobacter rubrisoli TaxID=2509675 RepID=A0A4P6K0T8_KTERU|nr:PQQ-binding-like beta-propeller repeat protein [Ktedonosporobacter rubrisoli]QBD81757.1 hypothetical protein EPA93_39610 [Ktedonosporobacter rubrisoli]